MPQDLISIDPIIVQFHSFASAGAISTAVHYLVLLAFLHVFLFCAALASIKGSIAEAVISYHRGCRSGVQCRFMYLMVSLAGIYYLLSQVVATGNVLLWNFSGTHLWSFAHEPQ